MSNDLYEHAEALYDAVVEPDMKDLGDGRYYYTCRVCAFGWSGKYMASDELLVKAREVHAHAEVECALMDYERVREKE